MDESTLGTEKNWLIRSSTRILGPYSLDEVTELLSIKQISIIDEIRQPSGRWSYIRENRKFLDLVKNLRKEEDSAGENTVTSASTVSSISSHTFTKTDALSSIDELTPTPIIRPDSVLRQQSGIKDMTSQTSVVSSHAAAPAIRKPLRSVRAEQKLNKSVRYFKLAITGAGIIILGIMGWVTLRKTQQATSGVEELTSLVYRYKDIGLYGKALEIYKRIQTLREPDFELQYQMAPLLISEERQSLLGRRTLEKAILSEGRSRHDLSNAHIGIALTYMQEANYQEAETFLQKAMTFEPSSLEAQINLGIIQMKKKNFTNAANEFDALAKRNPRSTVVLGLRAISWIESPKSAARTEVLTRILDDIKNEVNSYGAYLHQEMSLIGLHIAHILGDANSVNEAMTRFLLQLPLQSNLFHNSLYIDWRMLQWEAIEKYCAESFSGKLSAQQKAARAVCLMEVNRDDEANRLLNEAVSENPKETSLLVVEAAFFAKSRRTPEATALLKMPQVADQDISKQLLGMICLQQESVDCARPIYKALIEKNNRNIYALYGLAWIAQQEKNRAQAYDNTKAGLQLEPDYLPLIELRDQLESQ